MRSGPTTAVSAPPPQRTLGPAGVSPAIVFASIAVLALALRLACLTGLIGSDDLRYVKYANAVAEGHYGETLKEARTNERIHQGLRYGVIIPVAAVYKLVGVSEWSTVLLPLVASTASVLLLAAIALRLFDKRVAILAALLYATFPMQLRLATMLLPEPIAECFMLLGVLAFVHARDRGGVLWAAAGALIGAAYLAKEPALFAGLALGLHALWERRWRGAFGFALGVALVMAAEHAYYVLAHGDILFRAHSTQLFTIEPENAPPFSAQVAYSLRENGYPRAMLVPTTDFGLHSLVCLILAASALFTRPRHGYGLLLLWAVIPWLYLSYGSWSLQHWVPLPQEARYIMLVYPPLMLLAAVAASRAIQARASLARVVPAVLGVVMVAGVGSGLATRGRTARAEEMTVLREIVRAARATPGQTIYTDDSKWSRALVVIDRSLVAASPHAASFTITRGPLDFPVIQPVRPIQGHPERAPQ